MKIQRIIDYNNDTAVTVIYIEFINVPLINEHTAIIMHSL